MARTPQDVTEAELAVLRLLWDRKRDTIRKLTETLYPGGTNVHYATVQKLLERLESKKCVKRNRNDWPHTFQPAIEPDDLVRRRLQHTADKLCGGSLVPLVKNLVRSMQASAKDRESLRNVLAEFERDARPVR
ncbi:MAG: BlaI/MecI/CopY family transcriptional regulator [Planctomycetaceae bacterium]